MLHTLIGEESFQEGHASCTSSATTARRSPARTSSAAMADASGRDLGQFMRWYGQAGTPELKVSRSYDPARQALRWRSARARPRTPGQPEKLPFHIPIRLGLRRRRTARPQPLQLEGENEPKGTDRVLELTEADPALHLPGPRRPSRSPRCCAASRRR